MPKRKFYIYQWIEFGLICLLFINIGCKSQNSNTQKTIRILTFGDSITEGERPGVNSVQTYTYYLGKLLKWNGFDVEMIREGISGEDTDHALSRIKRDVIEKKPDYVIIMYGTNDAYIDVQDDETDTTPRIPLERYRKNLHTMVQTLRQNNIKPVLMTPIPMGNSWIQEIGIYKTNNINFKLKEYVEAVRRVSKEEKVPLVDHFRKWLKWKEWGKDINTLMTDGVHPNPDGHRFIAKSIFKVLKGELKAVFVIN
jgi:lysophospholipase L1-like esterase